MKLRRVLSVMLAFLLIMSVFSCAQAQAVVTGIYPVEWSSVDLNTKNGNFVVRDPDTRAYKIVTADGQELTSEPYIQVYPRGEMFEVAVESGLNTLGLIDAQGNEVVPMQYGDVEVYSDKWCAGVKLVEATAENYDYKSFDGDFYLVEANDFYFNGQLVGTLGRMDVDTYAIYVHGDYLYIKDREGNYGYYNSAFERSSYEDDYPSSSEYEERGSGIYHRGSNQKAFTAGCTLTADEVERCYEVVDGRVVDLQGNELGVVDSRFSSVGNFIGDYAYVRTNDGKYGLIDYTAREVIPAEYSSSSYGSEYFEGGYQILVKDGKVGYVNRNGEVTCEFRYAEGSVDSVYRMPMTTLSDLEGNVIVLSGAAGELPERYAEVNHPTGGCPLFAAMDYEGNAGVVDLYGQIVIPFDGLYDDTYDFTISQDGRVILCRDADNNRVVYTIDYAEGAPATGVAETEEAAVAGGALIDLKNNTAADVEEETEAEENGWTCECGQKNEGKFCSDCGTKRPEDKLACKKCGYEPEAGTTPKFCSECGTAF